MSIETWRPVEDAPGYEVSSHGRVRSYLQSSSGRVLKGRVQHKGHIRVALYTPSGKIEPLVHRLVAHAFIGPCPDGMEVCHNNGNPANNDVLNLRYDTHAENMFDAVRHGVHPQAKKIDCVNGHPFNEENTYRYQGDRYCRTCRRERNRARLSTKR